MRIIRSCIVAFSMYSRIPMPHFTWKDEDMTYMLCFFPMVGLVIGALFTGWYVLCRGMLAAGITQLFSLSVAAAIPLIVTGGFHLDGFMDTSDALSSWGDRQKKLEILKDSHIGAFAVIRTAICALLYLGGVAQLMAGELSFLLAAAASFVCARIFSAFAAINFPNARKEGMLFYTTSAADRKRNNLFLSLELLLLGLICLRFCGWAGAAMLVTSAVVFLIYWLRSQKEFGGITGDLEGYFVVVCETACMVVLGLLGIVMV